MSGTGYVRQSAGTIVSGLVITAAAHNNEFNQLQSAMDASSGHAHDGGTGGGAAIASLKGLASTAGMINFDGSTTFTPRTIVSTTTPSLTITNGAGTSGAPSFALGAELVALAAFASTGLLQRTGAATYAGKVLSLVLQTFTGNGTYTPTTGMLSCFVILTASGGSGGGGSFGGSGGSAGETGVGVYTAAQVGASQTVTIGAAATGGTTLGVDGNTTSLGSLLTAAGGKGGGTGVGAIGALGGTGGTGTGLHIQGGDGEAFSGDTAGNGAGGHGGASFWGGGGHGGTFTINALGTAGKAYGSGGGGCAYTSSLVLAGSSKAGVCILLELVLV